MSVRPPEVWASHEYAVIGAIFFFIFTVLPVIALSMLFIADPSLIMYYFTLLTGVIIPPAWEFPMMMGAGILAILAFLIFLAAYLTTVKRIDDGLYEAAKTPCLIMGILGLIFSLIIPGIFYMLAYMKLGEVILRYGPVASRTVLTPAGMTTT